MKGSRALARVAHTHTHTQLHALHELVIIIINRVLQCFPLYGFFMVSS